MTTRAAPDTSTTKSACPDSPTGAHHWMVGTPGTQMTGQCKHCGAERAFRPFEDWAGFNNSPKKHRSDPIADAG